MKFLVLPLLAVGARAYNRPTCDSWPSGDVWESDLGAQLSPEAALHGPILPERYDAECATLGTDAYRISAAADGICMHAHACAYEFCGCVDAPDFDLPRYVVEAVSPQDVRAALRFADAHDIPVSIKTTGHSYTGSSTAKDSLMIWMANFEKDGTIDADYRDSCGTSHDAVVGVGGGETWDDVIESVGEDYHVVTGGARTVSAVGGWLQGSGLSFTSRLYGLGVDQVVSFELVLPNATAVTADACTNPDLFWALRGGGGGTYGVVTGAKYKVHPVQSFVHVRWGLLGVEYLLSVGDFNSIGIFVDLWLRFWIEWSVKLDSRWAGGFFDGGSCFLYFAGTLDEAKETFLNEFDKWYEETLVTSLEFIPNVWGAVPPSSTATIVPNWYLAKGGPEASGDPTKTDQTGDAYAGAEKSVGARLMPLETVIDDPEGVHKLLFNLSLSGVLGPVNYWLGGNINDVSANETGVNPALRKAVYSVFAGTADSQEMVRKFVPNNVTGVCFNHHNVAEPDWRNACWGANYERLAQIKGEVDPNGRFNCWHCVGYRGREIPEVAEVSFVEPECPAPADVGAPMAAPVAPPVAAPTSGASGLWSFSLIIGAAIVAALNGM